MTKNCQFSTFYERVCEGGERATVIYVNSMQMNPTTQALAPRKVYVHTMSFKISS